MKSVFLIGAVLGLALFAEAFPSPSSSSRVNKVSFHSQAAQDQFVYTLLYDLLGKQDMGYYLEIGAGEPIQINNTYFFEKQLQWTGTSIDISEDLSKRWYAKRSNTLLTADATQCDYGNILQNFPCVIDYLSLDVDGLYDVVLERIPFSNHIFKIITIEHDAYRFGDIYRTRERQILQAQGYHLLCSNVMNDGYVFEDWWIHPSAFPDALFSELTSLDLEQKEYQQIIKAISSLKPGHSQNK